MHEYELQNQQALCGCLPLFPWLQPCSTSPRKPKMLHRLQALPRKLKKRWKIPPCLPAGHLLRRWDEGGEENGGKRSISPCWAPLIRHNNETSTFLDDRCEPCLGSSFFCAFMSYSFIHPLFVKIFQFWVCKKIGNFFGKHQPCRIPRCIPAGLPPLRQHRHHSSASTLNFRSTKANRGRFGTRVVLHLKIVGW